MFPGVYGFHWSAGYLIFLGIFFSVLIVVLTTFVLALRRAMRDFQARRTERIRWHGDFHDLPAGDRKCRHEITGEMPGRVCPSGFDCRACVPHAQWVEANPPVEDSGAAASLGIPVPLDRMYHRGHTWVQSRADGTVLVGLDELARRLTGMPGELELPPAGSRVEVNGTAWTMRRGRATARVLSPVEGEVVETGGPGKPFYLRVKPDHPGWNAAHLLRGAEVSHWMMRELERLQTLAGMPAVGSSLADGGVVMEDLTAGMPQADRDAVWGGMFLEP